MQETLESQRVARRFLGHPFGLAILFTTEMWERFSYYGMRALLMLYLVDYLLLPARAGSVVGLESLKSALEFVFGPLDPQPFASTLYGLYTSLVYLTPLLGGYLADRYLGRRRMVVIGAVLMCIGHFLMAVETLLLPALFALVLGNGAFKPNISTQVGDLYEKGDPRRDRAFSIFYVGINLGAFFSPLICGTLGEEVSWHYGFAAAGVGMAIGLATYLLGSKLLPPEAPIATRESAALKQPLTTAEWRGIAGLLALFLPNVLFFATYEQQGNTIALWADTYTDRAVDLGFLRFEIPVTWFQAFNPFMIFAFTPFLVALWTSQARRGKEPSTVMKMAIGCFGCALSYLIMAFAARGGEGVHASWLWLTAYFVVITISELYISPTGLSLVTKIAPERYLSFLMGVWLATSFAGNFLSGWLGTFWSSMAKADFFLLIAAIAAGAGAAIVIVNAPLARAINETPHSTARGQA